MNKLNGSLDDMKNGRFTESEVETSVAKTADKINEQLVNANNQEEKGIINNFVAVSVEAGNEAIAEVMEEKTVDREEKDRSCYGTGTLTRRTRAECDGRYRAEK
ncbi:MAG: hypothetical protein L6V87_04430 [Ruminococcus sp.]|nr:MAG: hypothetical protein L6V87_04430 [Ruminococcus sp.]